MTRDDDPSIQLFRDQSRSKRPSVSQPDRGSGGVGSPPVLGQYNAKYSGNYPTTATQLPQLPQLPTSHNPETQPANLTNFPGYGPTTVGRYPSYPPLDNIAKTEYPAGLYDPQAGIYNGNGINRTDPMSISADLQARMSSYGFNHHTLEQAAAAQYAAAANHGYADMYKGQGRVSYNAKCGDDGWCWCEITLHVT